MKFSEYSREDLIEIVQATHYTPEAAEAACELLNEKSVD